MDVLQFLIPRQRVITLAVGDRQLWLTFPSGNWSNPQLRSVASVAVPDGAIAQAELQQPEVVGPLLAGLLAELKLPKDVREVVISLDDAAGYHEVLRYPNLPDQELNDAVRVNLPSLLPWPAGGAYLDWELRPTEDGHPHREVYLSALPRQVVDPWLSLWQEIGWRPLSLEAASASIVRAIRHPSELTLLCHIRPGGLSMAFCRNGSPRRWRWLTWADVAAQAGWAKADQVPGSAQLAEYLAKELPRLAQFFQAEELPLEPASLPAANGGPVAPAAPASASAPAPVQASAEPVAEPPSADRPAVKAKANGKAKPAKSAEAASNVPAIARTLPLTVLLSGEFAQWSQLLRTLRSDSGLPVEEAAPDLPEQVKLPEAAQTPAALPLLGAVRRSLLPRSEDTLNSLLPIGTEDAYAKLKLTSFIHTVNAVLSAVAIAYLALFIGGFALLSYLKLNVSNQLERRSGQSVPEEQMRLTQQAAEFNALVASLRQQTADLKPRTAALRALSGLGFPGITITRLGLDPQSSVTLTGIARTRDALVAFKRQLEADPKIAGLRLPISSLATKENITFTMSFAYHP